MIDPPTASDVLGKCAGGVPLRADVPPLPHLTGDKKPKPRLLYPPFYYVLEMICGLMMIGYANNMIRQSGFLHWPLLLLLVLGGLYATVESLYGFRRLIEQRRESSSHGANAG
jgi:hypothetical protein